MMLPPGLVLDIIEISGPKKEEGDKWQQEQ